MTVLVTSALKRLIWTIPRRLLSNEFYVSGILPPSEKNLCWLRKWGQYHTPYLCKEIWSSGRANCVRFLEEIFPVANISPEVVFKMFFDVGAQKIEGTMLDTYGMVVTAFSVTNKANQSLECLSSPWMVQTLFSWIGNSSGELVPPTRPYQLPDASS